MEASDDKEEEVPCSETTLCKEQEGKRKQQKEEPGPSCLSFKSSRSKDALNFFNLDQPSDAKRLDQTSDVGQPPHEHQMQLGSIFMELEKKIVMFVKDELKDIQKVLRSDYPECSEGLEEDDRVSGNKDEKQSSSRSSREAFLKITVDFLRIMNLDDLADLLQSSKRVIFQQK